MMSSSNNLSSGFDGLSLIPLKRSLILWSLIVAAFLIRFSLFLLEPLITPDGLNYTESGINLVSGNGYVNALGDFRGKLQPLYPILIGIANFLVHDVTFSGALVSMIFGSFLIWPVFQFTKAAYDEGTAYTASFIVVGYPYLVNYASTALTEATYTFFLFSAAWWAWIAFQHGRNIDFVICGILSGLGYLTRFEIAPYLLFYIVFVLFASRGQQWRQIFILTVIFIFIITPYHLYNWLETGSPMLLGRIERGARYMVNTYSLGQVDSPWSSFFGEPVRFAQHYIKGVGTAYTEYLPTLFPPLLIAITGAGLAEIYRRGALGFTELYLCTIVTITLFGYPILRPSGRNLTVALPFLIVLLAKGISQISQIIDSKLAFTRWRVARSAGITAVVTTILCITVLPQTYRPFLVGPDPLAPIELMNMGKWVQANIRGIDAIITPDRRVSFYAGIQGVSAGLHSTRYNYENILEKSLITGVRHIVVTSYGPSDIDWQRLKRRIREDGKMKLIHSISERPKMIVQLYELIER